MSAEILPGVSPKLIRETLAKKGVITLDGRGQLKSLSLPKNLGKQRAYVIDSQLL
jgi:hypothetical protein